MLAYFTSMSISGGNSDFVVNNYFAALFHDLPESFTRDIISPVKTGLNIRSIILEAERQICDDYILPQIKKGWSFENKPAAKGWSKDFAYIIGVPSTRSKNKEITFEDRIIDNSRIKLVASTADLLRYKGNSFPVSGKLVKICDTLSGFVEAQMSKEYGICSKELDDGLKATKKALKAQKVCDMAIGDFFTSAEV
jgi:putative hydrolase of HD superfamily